MPEAIPLQVFLKQSEILIDVRSPSEFQQGHIPGSYSLPLFSDEERALIGTAYKQQGQNQAIDLGLKIIGPKLSSLVEAARAYQALSNRIGIACWRGGMRSGFFARLLESLGFKTWTLQGGYRSYRRWAAQILTNIPEQRPRLIVLGGLTGSRKTAVLQSLKLLNEQVIDLEDVAQHHGSAFGHLGMPMTGQPSQEQFENLLAYQWTQLDLSYPIWIEDESRLVGQCCIPNSLYQYMKKAPLFYLERAENERLTHLVNTYGHANAEDLIQATQRIKKRLGNQLVQEITQLLLENQKREAFKKLLIYYDKTYLFQLAKRESIETINAAFVNEIDCAKHLKEMSNQVFHYAEERSDSTISSVSR